MKTWHFWALAVTIGLGGCGDDAAADDVGGGEVTDGQTPWDLHAERALPAMPAGYGVRARGNVIAIRGDDGLWRSDDGGATFSQWTRERTLDVLPRSNGTGTQVRREADSTLRFEALDRAGQATPLSGAITSGAVRSAIAASLAPGTNDDFVVVTPQVGSGESSRIYMIRFDGDTRELALPEAPPESAWSVVDLDGRLALLGADRVFVHVDDGWRDVMSAAEVTSQVASADGALVQARNAAGVTSIVRVELAADGAIAHEAATPTAMAMHLARGDDPVIHAVSTTIGGRVVMRSADGGRTWQTLATSLEVSSAFDPRVQVARSGLWTLDLMFPTWRPHEGPPGVANGWRIAGLPPAQEVQHLQAQGDERWFVSYRQPLAGIVDGGAFVFYSKDRGATWQLGGNVGVNVGCFTVTPTFLFFGGGGDVAGAWWETRDRTGRTLIRNDKMRVTPASPGGHTLPIIACASTGGPSVVAAQAEDGKVPTVLHGVNLQHQTSEEPMTWSPWSFDPRHRVTALDGDGVGLDPILAAGELLIQATVGYESQPETAFWDSFVGDFVWSRDLYRGGQLGARGATRRHGDVYVYPTGIIEWLPRTRREITGLPSTGLQPPVADALIDDQGVWWIATPDGLYRDGEPVAPALEGCEVDADCPGFVPGNLCNTGVRCRDGACTQVMAETCAGRIAPAPCERMECQPATGQCVAMPSPDYAPCGPATLCQLVDYCLLGECLPGTPVDCAEGATECGPRRCDPARGCVTDHQPAGSVCGEVPGDVCTAPSRCTGVSGPCVAPEDGTEVCALSTSGAGCEGAEDCDDDNPCTRDTCSDGACAYAPEADGTTCEHGDACRGAGVCSFGWCTGGAVLADGTPCDDGEACVKGSACASGYCVGGTAEGDGTPCDDGFSCTSADHCERGFCVGDRDDPACEGLAACTVCDAPAGEALLVGWSDVNTGGVAILSLRGARLGAITPIDPKVAGVVHDHVRGDGLWVSGFGTESQRALYKIAWDGRLLQTLEVRANVANWQTAGPIDHVLAGPDGADVLVQRHAVASRRFAVVSPVSGDVLSSVATHGTGGVLVDAFVPVDGLPVLMPRIWTGDVGARLVLELMDDEVEARAVLPPLPTIYGITRDVRGDFWIGKVQHDSQVARVRPSGQVTRSFTLVYEGFTTGVGEPRIHDIDHWPGRAAFAP